MNGKLLQRGGGSALHRATEPLARRQFLLANKTPAGQRRIAADGQVAERSLAHALHVDWTRQVIDARRDRCPRLVTGPEPGDKVLAHESRALALPSHLMYNVVTSMKCDQPGPEGEATYD